MVCGGQTSRLEVARELLKLLNLDREIKLTAVSSDFFKDVYFAERPPCERLRNRKLQIRDLNVMKNWKVSLKEYLDAYYYDYLPVYDRVTF
jgi:dTDP-4-dehydrorhamnose reductase